MLTVAVFSKVTSSHACVIDQSCGGCMVHIVPQKSMSGLTAHIIRVFDFFDLTYFSRSQRSKFIICSVGMFCSHLTQRVLMLCDYVSRYIVCACYKCRPNLTINMATRGRQLKTHFWHFCSNDNGQDHQFFIVGVSSYVSSHMLGNLGLTQFSRSQR